MCLGVPGKVLSVEGLLATVDFWGVQKQVMLHIIDQPVVPGDYLLNHVGYAIRRIPSDEIEATLAMYDQLIASTEDGDLMARDVRDEIEAAGQSQRR